MFKKISLYVLVFALLLALSVACSDSEEETPSVTPSTVAPVATATPAPTSTVTPTNTPMPTSTVTPTSTPEPAHLIFHVVPNNYYYPEFQTIHMKDGAEVELPTMVLQVVKTIPQGESFPEGEKFYLCGVHYWINPDDITSQRWDYKLILNLNGEDFDCLDLNQLYWGDEYDSEDFEKVWRPWVPLSQGVVSEFKD